MFHAAYNRPRKPVNVRRNDGRGLVGCVTNLIPIGRAWVYDLAMVESLKTSVSGRQSALADLLARRASAKTSEKSTGYKPKGREIHDTVEISGGNKIVNLARGYDLAAEVRKEKDPEKVREMVKQGTADIQRIGKLFQETFVTLRSLFGRKSY